MTVCVARQEHVTVQFSWVDGVPRCVRSFGRCVGHLEGRCVEKAWAEAGEKAGKGEIKKISAVLCSA